MLPSNTTILSLHRPGSAYYQGVLENLLQAIAEGLDPATTVVRVGLRGSGESPNYRIESPQLVETHSVPVRGLDKELSLTTTGLYKIYRGPTHKEKTELDHLESHPENWSKSALTLAELQA